MIRTGLTLEHDDGEEPPESSADSRVLERVAQTHIRLQDDRPESNGC
jgi:hypothetical protein